jgi:hypothetical protein
VERWSSGITRQRSFAPTAPLPNSLAFIACGSVTQTSVGMHRKQPIVLENVREDSKDSRFVDAILEAVAKAS